MNTKITYAHSYEAWNGYTDFVKNLIDKYPIITICDIGGGAHPVLSLDYVESNNINYTLLDISEQELARAPDKYAKVKRDIASEDFVLEKKFDFVFSKMLAEHVRNARQFHKNVFKILNNGGLALHFFPTLYTLPFLVNRLLPKNITQKILNLFSPRDTYQHPKFPAYYKWCRGPSKKQIQKFENLEYRVIEYRGFFGHRYYKRVNPLQKLHDIKTDYLLENPNPLFASFAYLVLQKPKKKDSKKP